MSFDDQPRAVGLLHSAYASDCGLGIARCGLSEHESGSRSEIRNSKYFQPLRVMFLQTDMRIGGAEMITASIIRRLDRGRFSPELCCLKERGALGEELAGEIPVHHGLLRNKFDLRVWPRLTRLLRARQIDAVITVGAGDKMFWGRLAARRVGVPVVLSALHSTGWPDGVGRLNRMLTPITDGFIAVAESHGRYLVEHERFPAGKVTVIRNGVDTQRFSPLRNAAEVRQEIMRSHLNEKRSRALEKPGYVVGIVAALRPEKNHELFLEMARRVVQQLPAARFVIIGEGPCRAALEQRTREMRLESHVSFFGARSDVPRLLAAMDVFALTSHVEANPLSILEAMSAGRPVVATNVGSIHEAVVEGQTGFLVAPGDADQLAERVLRLLNNPQRCRAMGEAARRAVVDRWSIDAMVGGYERLIRSMYDRKVASSSNGNCGGAGGQSIID